MPLVSLIAEGVGPFQSLELDLSDGKGNPHLGPHILAGVNGSGKSTVLRTIAWVLDGVNGGFPYEDWGEMLRGYGESRARLTIRPPRQAPYLRACAKDTGGHASHDLAFWLAPYDTRRGPDDRPVNSVYGGGNLRHLSDSLPGTAWIESAWKGPPGVRFSYAAYSPSRSLRRLPDPNLSLPASDAFKDSLAFESTVQNEAIQSWLLGLLSRRAIAMSRNQAGDQYAQSLERFENALRLIYGDISVDAEIDPRFELRLRMGGRSLNFSQLPEGVRSTVGWLADFMMRQDRIDWKAPWFGGHRPGVLLLDEVDVHLHPRWQRSLLPAMREALPDVQIIATSHSPFVISSCPGSRVHVLELDAEGHARARPPVDAPIGESVTTTLKEIFGVDSRFDILTERELKRWDELKEREVTGVLSPEERDRLKELTLTLSERSEELRALVASPLTMPKTVLDDLIGPDRPTAARTKRPKKRA